MLPVITLSSRHYLSAVLSAVGSLETCFMLQASVLHAMQLKTYTVHSRIWSYANLLKVTSVKALYFCNPSLAIYLRLNYCTLMPETGVHKNVNCLRDFFSSDKLSKKVRDIKIWKYDSFVRFDNFIVKICFIWPQ